MFENAQKIPDDNISRQTVYPWCQNINNTQKSTSLGHCQSDIIVWSPHILELTCLYEQY